MMLTVFPIVKSFGETHSFTSFSDTSITAEGKLAGGDGGGVGRSGRGQECVCMCVCVCVCVGGGGGGGGEKEESRIVTN